MSCKIFIGAVSLFSICNTLNAKNLLLTIIFKMDYALIAKLSL